MGGKKNDLKTKVSRKLTRCFGSSKVFWIYLSTVVIFGLISLIVCIVAGKSISNQFESDSYLFSLEMIWLWQRPFILDIVTTKADFCPKNYQEAQEYTWPGTKVGCACPYKDS